MTETEAPEVVAPVVVPSPAAAAVEEEPAKRAFVKRLPKPDQSLVKAAVEKLKDQISQNQQRQDAIRDELEKRRNGRVSSPEQQNIKNRLMELRSKFQALLAEKKQVRVQLDAANGGRDALREQLKGMKGKMEYTSVEKIDEAIARLESQLQHSSMPLAQEKKILEDIKKLRASRTSVASYNDKLERLNGDDQSRSAIVDRLKASDEQLEKVKAEEQILREQLSTLQAKDAKKYEDVPALKEERDQCREVVKLLRAKVDEVKGAAQVKNDEYWQAEQAYRESRAAEKIRRDAEWVATKAERDVAYKARQAELAGEPFNQEVTLCDQVEAYLARFAGGEKAPEVAAAAVAVAAPQGTRALVKEVDLLEDKYTLSGSGGKKGKKAKKAERSAAAKPVDQRLNHSLDILGAFAKLKIEVPLTTSQVPAVIEAVKGKKEEFLAKRVQVKEKGFPAEEEETDGPATNGSAEPRAPRQARAAPMSGAHEPTPAESMGAAPAAESGSEGAPPAVVALPSGPWKSAEAAAPAAVPVAEEEAAAVPAEAAVAEVAAVAVALEHGENGHISVALNVEN